MQVKNPDAAGIDISSREHFVAVPADRDKNPVRKFDSFTEDLYQLAGWLKQCRIKTVAMGSTGVYWYHLFTILQEEGFEVYLVNAWHIKNVPGRKSDVSDCQWIQQLHSYGLLSNSFQPDELTRELRNYTRQRKTIVQDMSTAINRMQKSMELMNIKLNNVIRDITGKSGMKIIEAILSGERDAEKLASFADYRIRASRKKIIKSLQAHYRQDQLFNLRQSYDHYQFLLTQLKQCDQMAEQTIDRFNKTGDGHKTFPKERPQKNQPDFDVRKHLFRIHGVDVMQIHGLKGTSGLTILSETGPDLQDKFPTEKQFCSWLNVVPDNKISGGKVISSTVKKKKNKAGQAFRDAANTLWSAKGPLGDSLRNKRARKGSKQAVVATARKLASIYYKMVTEKVEFSLDIIIEQNKKLMHGRYNQLVKKLEKAKVQLSHAQDFSPAVSW